MICRRCGRRILEGRMVAGGKCPYCGYINPVSSVRKHPVNVVRNSARPRNSPSRANPYYYGGRNTRSAGRSVARYPANDGGKHGNVGSFLRGLLKRRLWKLPVWAWACIALGLVCAANGDSGSKSQDTVRPPITATSGISISQNNAAMSLDSEVPKVTLEPVWTVAPFAEATQAPTFTATPAATREPVLQRGDKGDQVRAMQQVLHDLGYLKGEADGAFGEGTEASLRKYQVDNRLPETGICDYQTYLSMTSEANYCYVTPKGGKYHEKNCKTLHDSDIVKRVTVYQAKAAGREPCGVCGG